MNKTTKILMRKQTMKLYYHKTDGGAEYLTDRWTRNPDGSKEGVFKNARFIVRVDGDLRCDAELTVVQPTKENRIGRAGHRVRG